MRREECGGRPITANETLVASAEDMYAWKPACAFEEECEETLEDKIEEKRIHQEEYESWLWLSSAEGMTAKKFEFIMNTCGSARAARESFSRFAERLGPKTCDRLRETNHRAWIEKLLEYMDRNGIYAIRRGDPRYPKILAEIEDPPATLYVRGMWDEFQHAVAIVGTRRCTQYGRTAAIKLGRELGKIGVLVVSGLAIGVDASAHEGALAGNGRTVAVLAGGVDDPYPKANLRLAERILQNGGALVSEYPPGTPNFKGHFYHRNRIISGLCQGVVLVEADEGSGSLITIQHADDQERDIFAVPGMITARLSAIPNRMLAFAPDLPFARVVRNAGDIVDGLGWTLKFVERDESAMTLPLSHEESRVVELLKNEPRGFEELVSEGRFGVKELNAILTTLEIRGIMKQLPGKIFQLT